MVLGVGILISGPDSAPTPRPYRLRSGFYMVRQERPRWPVSLGHMVEVRPPYRRGHGLVVWWFRERQEDPHDWGWVPLDALQIGWGRPRTIDTWVPEDIATWQAPEEDVEVVETAAEAPSAGSAR